MFDLFLLYSLSVWFKEKNLPTWMSETKFLVLPLVLRSTWSISNHLENQVLMDTSMAYNYKKNLYTSRVVIFLCQERTNLYAFTFYAKCIRINSSHACLHLKYYQNQNKLFIELFMRWNGCLCLYYPVYNTFT